MDSKLHAFKDLGKALRLLRGELSQVAVAERTGIAQNRLSRYEPAPKRSGNDPELTARVQDALIQLGYPKPDPNNTAPAD